MSKRAILFGINNYKHANVPDLRGCENDIDNLEELLVDKFLFDSNHIRARANEEVTLDTVKEDWKWLVKKARAGDQLVFHFSGHGSQVANDGDDYEKDGLDEILCLYDMDFHNPDTYLVDDQIYRWTKKLPKGVKMTILLDCCHSGTGTRTLNPPIRSRGVSTDQLPLVIERASAARAKRSEVRRAMKKGSTRSVGRGEKANDANLVLARYLVPPSDVFERVEKRSRHRASGKAATRSATLGDTNHVRFSGCKDEQTSADAFIDGQFQGAFSAYFRQTIEDAGSDVSHSDLINQVRDALADADFEQTPQLNPTRLRTPVFDGLDDHDRYNEDCNGVNDSGSSSGDAARPADVRRLIAKIDELIEAVESKCGGPGGPRRRHGHGRHGADGGRRREIGDRSIVYVHGICWHDEGYSDEWFESLRPHLDRDLANELARNHHEVLWSHHVSSGPRDLAASHDRAATRNATDQQLVDQLQDILRDRAAQAMTRQMSPTHSRGAQSEMQSRDLERSLFGVPGLDCVDDFVKYLTSDRTRRKVMGEFTKVVEPLLEAGHGIEVISHSWGTVVAFEALHQLSRDSYEGQVNSLFTVGSALSIGPVQRMLKFGARSGDKPRLVNSWINLDARGDIVGGTLRGFSSEPLEHLDLDPTGCPERFFGPSPACAHSSYFHAQNTTVNRDIFADNIS